MSYEDQGAGYDPGATGHELQGRAPRPTRDEALRWLESFSTSDHPNGRFAERAAEIMRHSMTNDPRVEIGTDGRSIKICGVRYSMEMFETLGFGPYKDGRWLKVIARDECVWLFMSIPNSPEVDALLSSALHDAGSSALGMPGTVDTFKAMLKKAGLDLVVVPPTEGGK